MCQPQKAGDRPHTKPALRPKENIPKGANEHELWLSCPSRQVPAVWRSALP